MKTSCLDNRRFNTPPPPNNAIKRFDKTVSARIEASLLYELDQNSNQKEDKGAEGKVINGGLILLYFTFLYLHCLGIAVALQMHMQMHKNPKKRT
jgi:hypothetical protein